MNLLEDLQPWLISLAAFVTVLVGIWRLVLYWREERNRNSVVTILQEMA